MSENTESRGPKQQQEMEDSAVAAAAEAGYAAEYAAITETAVEALTAMARLRHPRFGQADFAEFLAHACSAAAANVGSVGRLLAGRSGSWEADLVAQLVNGTVGWDGEYLPQHRTEPIVIHLNVDRLLVDRMTGPGYVTGYERDVNACHARWDELTEDEVEAQPAEAFDRELDAIEATWAARYAAYADAFTTVVQAEAARIEGLAVPVTVEAITRPDAGYEGAAHPNETLDDWDPIVSRLWEHAISTVPLPGADPREDAS